MRHLLLIFVCLWCVGCEAEPTPVPMVSVPTTTSDTITEAVPEITATPAPLAIGILEQTIDYGKGLEALEAFGTVSPISDSSDTSTFNILAGYGVVDGWAQSPTTHHLMILLNPQLEPLDDPEIATIVRQSIDTRALVNALAIDGLTPNTDIETAIAVTQRTQLANMGYPDGLALTLATSTILGRDVLVEQMTQNAIDLSLIEIDPDAMEQPLTDNTAHMVLLIATDAERDTLAAVYDDAILELVSLPISYEYRLGISFTFTDAGWPIPQWAN